MTTYSASKMAAGVQPRVLPTGQAIAVISSLAFAASPGLATGDLVNMLNIAADASEQNPGPFISGVTIDSDQLDTGSGIVLAAGDSTTAARFITGSTVAQAGGIQEANVAGTIGYQPFASTFGTYTTISQQTYTVVVKATTGATTPKAGTLRVKVDYTYDP